MPGSLRINSGGNLGTGPLNFDGGTLEAFAAGVGIVSSKAVMLDTGRGTFLADSGATSTLSGAISGVGSATEFKGQISIFSLLLPLDI